MKKKGVCNGCRYQVTYKNNNSFAFNCDYCEMTGRSRLVKEREEGGYKKDSCVCYEKRKKKNRRFHICLDRY